MRNILIVVLLTFFGTFVFGLKCRCTPNIPNSPCDSDGTCTVDKGVCVVVLSSTGSIVDIQQQCSNEPTVGCVKSSVSTYNSIQCMCDDKDLCNTNVTQTDFGTRSSTTIKCKCTIGQTGCDSSGTCSTTGICARSTQPGADIQQCADQGGQIGCLKLKYNAGQEASQCGCENKDYCNGQKSAGKQDILTLLVVLPTVSFLFNRF